MKIKFRGNPIFRTVVCGKHFVLGSQLLTGINMTWIGCPHCNLARRTKLDHYAKAKRAVRANKREQLAVERQERKAAEKRRKLLLRSTLASQVLRQNKREIKKKGMRRPFPPIWRPKQLAKVKKSNRKLFIRTPSAELRSLTTCFRQADIKPLIRISLTLTIKFVFTLGYRLWKY